MSIQKWPRGVVNQSLERKKKEDILEKSGGVKGSPSLFVKDKGKEKKKRKEKESRIVQGNGNLKSHCWVARANSSRAHFFRRQFGLTLTSTSVFFSSFSPGKGKKKKRCREVDRFMIHSPRDTERTFANLNSNAINHGKRRGTAVKASFP